MANLRDNEVNYLSWLDSAVHFYLAARLLWSHELWMPSLFCVQQSVETLLKAACFYFDPRFVPQTFGHDLRRLEAHLMKLNPMAKSISVPVQFYHERRWQEATRYPEDKGVGWRSDDLAELDKLFCNVITSIPFQFTNSGLFHILCDDGQKRERNIMRHHNPYFDQVYKFVIQHAVPPQ